MRGMARAQSWPQWFDSQDVADAIPADERIMAGPPRFDGRDLADAIPIRATSALRLERAPRPAGAGRHCASAPCHSAAMPVVASPPRQFPPPGDVDVR
jgi:hypothetical protein